MKYFRIKEQYFDHIDNKNIGKNIFLYDDNGYLHKIVNSKNTNDETKFIYNKSGILISMESYINNKRSSYSILKYSFKIFKRKTLKEMTIFGTDGNITDHYVYIYQNRKRIETIHFSIKKQDKIKYFHKYDGEKRVGTNLQNGEIYSTREYDENDLLKSIKTKDGGIVTFLWENGYSNYNYDLYYLS